LTTLKIIEEEGLVENAATVGAFGLQMARQLESRHPCVGDVRGQGLVMGIEIVADRKTKDPANTETEKIFYKALQRGLSLKTTGNILALSPPLIITRAEMERAFSIIDACLTDVESERPR
jgi:4-aminobutyrate aminotransferase